MSKTKILLPILGLLVVLLVGRPKTDGICNTLDSKVNPYEYCCEGLTPAKNSYDFECKKTDLNNLSRISILRFELSNLKNQLKGTKLVWKTDPKINFYQINRIDNKLITPLAYLIPVDSNDLNYFDETSKSSSYQILGYKDEQLISISDELDSAVFSQKELDLNLKEINILSAELKSKLLKLNLIKSKNLEVKLKKDIIILVTSLDNKIKPIYTNKLLPNYNENKIKNFNKKLLSYTKKNKNNELIQLTKSVDQIYLIDRIKPL